MVSRASMHEASLRDTRGGEITHPCVAESSNPNPVTRLCHIAFG